jgi:hypothetical protein
MSTCFRSVYLVWSSVISCLVIGELHKRTQINNNDNNNLNSYLILEAAMMVYR